MASTLVQSIAQVSETHPERRPGCSSSTSALFSIDWLDQPFCSDGDTEPHAPTPTTHMYLQHPSSSSSPSSPSEFEFSMCALGSPASASTHMLSADQLFHDGKLLPLYPAASLAPPPSRRSNAEESIRADGSTPAAALAMNGNGLKQHSPAAMYSASMAGMGSTCTQQHRVGHRPLSPKAPTCTSRWKELLGLRKAQTQDVQDGPDHWNKAQARAAHHHGWHASEQLVAGRRSTDAGNANEPPVKLRTSEIGSQEQGVLVPCCLLQEPSAFNPDHASSCPSTIQRSRQQSEMAIPSSRSSEDLMERSGLKLGMDTQRVNGSDGDGVGATTRHRHSSTAGNRARSPSKQRSEQWSNGRTPANTSPRRGGSRGVSPGRPSVGSRPTESSRSAIAPRLVVRGLDRSYSSPRPMRRRPEQLRSVIGRQKGDGSSSSSTALERSISYSAGVRVSPVINVPVYITPTFRKGSKSGILNFFSSKKEKAPSSANNNNKKPLTTSPL